MYKNRHELPKIASADLTSLEPKMHFSFFLLLLFKAQPTVQSHIKAINTSNYTNFQQGKKGK